MAYKTYPRIIAIVSTLLLAPAGQAADPAPFFNGENLEGWSTWYRHDDHDRDLFTVTDGMIHVYKNQESGSEQTFAGLVSNKEYSRYVLTLEYRWGEKKFQPRDEAVRDAGILFHVHGNETIWPNSVECQLQEGDTGDIWAIGTRVTAPVNVTVRSYHPQGERVTRGGGERRFNRFHRGYMWEVPGWNRVEVRVDGDYAKYTVNGHVVNEVFNMKYHDIPSGEWKPLTRGKILLQAEGAEVFYRNISLTPLDDQM